MPYYISSYFRGINGIFFITLNNLFMILEFISNEFMLILLFANYLAHRKLRATLISYPSI